MSVPDSAAHHGSRVDDLQRRLLDEADPHARARIHLELARSWVRDGQLDPAVRHLRETLRFDAGSAAARHLLADLGQPVDEPAPSTGVVRRLWLRVTGRG